MIPIFTPPQGDGLGKGVAKSVMQAALEVEDPCDGVGAKNGGFTTKEYDWNYTVGQKLVYYAKKGGPAGPTDYDFMIEFDGGEQRVWVEDVPEDPEQTAQEIVSKRAYSLYVLRVAVGDTDIGEYGQSARIKAISEYAMSTPAIATYAGACAVTTGICEAFKGPAGWAKAIAYDLPGCVVAAVFSGMTFSMEATASKEAYAKSIGVGALIGMGSEAFQYKLATRGLGTRWLGLDKGTTMMHIKWIAKEDAGAPKKVGDILELLRKSPSGLAGVDYKKVPVGTVLGIEAKDLDKLREALEKSGQLDKPTEEAIENLEKLLKKPVGDIKDPKDVQRYVEALFKKQEDIAKELRDITSEIEDLRLKAQTGKLTEGDKIKLLELGKKKKTLEEAGETIKNTDEIIEKTVKNGDELAEKIVEEAKTGWTGFFKSMLCSAAGAAAGSIASYALLATKLNAAITTLGVHINPAEGAVKISTNIGHVWHISGRSIWFIKFGQPEYYIEAGGS